MIITSNALLCIFVCILDRVEREREKENERERMREKEREGEKENERERECVNEKVRQSATDDMITALVLVFYGWVLVINLNFFT